MDMLFCFFWFSFNQKKSKKYVCLLSQREMYTRHFFAISLKHLACERKKEKKKRENHQLTKHERENNARFVAHLAHLAKSEKHTRRNMNMAISQRHIWLAKAAVVAAAVATTTTTISLSLSLASVFVPTIPVRVFHLLGVLRLTCLFTSIVITNYKPSFTTYFLTTHFRSGWKLDTETKIAMNK